MKEKSMEKPLRIIKACHELKNFISQDLYESLLNECDITEEECNNRIKGIKKEAEFILALDMLGCCRNITPLDEGFSNALGVFSSDVLLNLKDESNVFLEIKYVSKKDFFHISKGNLDKRVKYANAHNLKLLFAINIKGLWMLFDSNYVEHNGNKITYLDYNNSILNDYFGFKTYLIENFESIEIYGRRTKNVIGIYDPKYGTLISQEILSNNKRVFKIKKKDKKYYRYLFAYESLLERASIDTQSDNDVIIVRRKIQNKQIINEIELLLTPISHLEMNPGVTYLKHI